MTHDPDMPLNPTVQATPKHKWAPGVILLCLTAIQILTFPLKLWIVWEVGGQRHQQLGNKAILKAGVFLPFQLALIKLKDVLKIIINTTKEMCANKHVHVCTHPQKCLFMWNTQPHMKRYSTKKSTSLHTDKFLYREQCIDLKDFYFLPINSGRNW